MAVLRRVDGMYRMDAMDAMDCVKYDYSTPESTAARRSDIPDSTAPTIYCNVP